MVRRSLLFSPGDKPHMMEKGLAGDADGVIFDLEDAVAPSRKTEARETVCGVVAELNGPDKEVMIRVNPIERGGLDDAASLAASPPDTIILPMADGPDAVGTMADHLAEVGVPDVGIVPLVETPAAIVALHHIAAADGVTGLAFGAEDFTAQLRATRTKTGTELLYARERLVVAARAAGVDALDTVFTDIDDRKGLQVEAEHVAGLGFDGKCAIHPSQVPVINEAFTPDDEAVDWARRVLAAAEEAETDGAGAFTVDGEMIDPPIVERARTIVAKTGAADPDDGEE